MLILILFCYHIKFIIKDFIFYLEKYHEYQKEHLIDKTKTAFIEEGKK